MNATVKVGINLHLWTTALNESHYPLLHSLKSAGYDGVEVPVRFGTAADYHAIGKQLDSLDLGRTATLSLGAEYNLISADPKIRRHGLKELKRRIDLTAALGGEVIAGPFQCAPGVFTGQPPTRDEFQWSADALRTAAEYAAQFDIILTPEAVNRFACYLTNTMEHLDRLVSMVDHPNLQMLYDTHHAHIEEKNVAAVIARYGHKIRHVQISENDRGTPGSGQVRWMETFRSLREIGYDHWLTIEAFGRYNEAFAPGVHAWRNYQETLEEIYQDGIAFIRQMWGEV